MRKLPAPRCWGWTRRRDDGLHHAQLHQPLDCRAHLAALRAATVESQGDLLHSPRAVLQLAEIKGVGGNQAKPRCPIGSGGFERPTSALSPRRDDRCAVIGARFTPGGRKLEPLRSRPARPLGSSMVFVHFPILRSFSTPSGAARVTYMSPRPLRTLLPGSITGAPNGRGSRAVTQEVCATAGEHRIKTSNGWKSRGSLATRPPVWLQKSSRHR